MARGEDTLFMETTRITASRTAAEVSEVLIRSGATQIATDYKNARVSGLRWTMMVDGRDMLFNLPARVEPVFQLLKARSERRAYGRTYRLTPATLIELREKAERVAWRQLLRWTQAQLAMIEVGMAKAQEVFLPYWEPSGNGKTVFDIFEAQKFKVLPAPSEEVR